MPQNVCHLVRQTVLGDEGMRDQLENACENAVNTLDVVNEKICQALTGQQDSLSLFIDASKTKDFLTGLAASLDPLAALEMTLAMRNSNNQEPHAAE